MQEHVFLWWPGNNCDSLARTLIHLPYSSDIAPLDFHLFPSSQILLMEKISPVGKSFLEDCKRHLEQFFAQKDKKFWDDAIMQLPEKWQNLAEQNDKHIVQ